MLFVLFFVGFLLCGAGIIYSIIGAIMVEIALGLLLETD